MASMNLEDMPQLVLEKIISFLNLKQLLALEQVSTKLKCAVNAYFAITDRLIIGSLPIVERNGLAAEVTAKGKMCMDGFLNIIKRCGIRLRTIEITVIHRLPYGQTSIHNYNNYFQHIFASDEMSDSCPNVENIIVVPKMTNVDYDMFRKQNVLLEEAETERYASKIKLSTGKACKLRSILLDYGHKKFGAALYKRILNLYAHLEQIGVDDFDDSFVPFLPQFIQNGLKDLNVLTEINVKQAKKYCDVGKDLRTLRFTAIPVYNYDDVDALNKLKLPKNAEIGIQIGDVYDCFGRLNQNVCNSIILCEVHRPVDYRLMSKLKNLPFFDLIDAGSLQVIAENPFPELIEIFNTNRLCSCEIRGTTCNLLKFLPTLIIDKGHQLTVISIRMLCDIALSAVWKALKHCTAAKIIRLGEFHIRIPLTITYEDVTAICQLPKLQQFQFSISRYGNANTYCGFFRDLMQRVVREHTNFQFIYTDSYKEPRYLLDRIHY